MPPGLPTCGGNGVAAVEVEADQSAVAVVMARVGTEGR